MKRMILAAAFIGTTLFATDYSQMSIEELSAMRGSVPSEERDAFRDAIQSKMQSLTPEERQAYASQRQNSDTKGQQTRQHLRDGSGAGKMKRGNGRGGNR